VSIHLADATEGPQGTVAEVAFCAQFLGMQAMRENNFSTFRVVCSGEVGVTVQIESCRRQGKSKDKQESCSVLQVTTPMSGCIIIK
jgi:hypothetical protein